MQLCEVTGIAKAQPADALLAKYQAVTATAISGIKGQVQQLEQPNAQFATECANRKQEMEELSEEAQPVGSARTRSLLLSGPTLNLALLEELQVNT